MIWLSDFIRLFLFVDFDFSFNSLCAHSKISSLTFSRGRHGWGDVAMAQSLLRTIDHDVIVLSFTEAGIEETVCSLAMMMEGMGMQNHLVRIFLHVKNTVKMHLSEDNDVEHEIASYSHRLHPLFD